MPLEMPRRHVLLEMPWPQTFKYVPKETPKPTSQPGQDPEEQVVRVRLLQTVWAPPHQCDLARATTDPKLSIGPIVFELSERMEQEWGILAEDSLVEPQDDGTIQVALTNLTGITQMVNAGETIGDVTGTSVVCAEKFEVSEVKIMSARNDSEQILAWERCRQEKLKEAIGELDLPNEENETFQTFLTRHHCAFCLEPGERGETDLIRMEIDTGDAHPRK